MEQQQLRARLFTLSANRGVEFGLGYIEHLEQDSIIPLWVYCCGAEMGLARQLPERAQSRAAAYDAELRRGNPEQEAAQVRNATMQCADGSWW